MDDRNPYTPPTSAPAPDAQKQPLKLAEYLLLGFALLQVLFALRYAGLVLELVRTGALNVLYLLNYALSVALLALGAALTLARSRWVIYGYALAAVFSILAIFPLRPPFAITGVIVSLGGCVISLIRSIKART